MTHFNRTQMKSHTHTLTKFKPFPSNLLFSREKRVLHSVARETLISIRSNNEHTLGGIVAYNLAFSGGIIEEQVSCDH